MDNSCSLRKNPRWHRKRMPIRHCSKFSPCFSSAALSAFSVVFSAPRSAGSFHFLFGRQSASWKRIWSAGPRPSAVFQTAFPSGTEAVLRFCFFCVLTAEFGAVGLGLPAVFRKQTLRDFRISFIGKGHTSGPRKGAAEIGVAQGGDTDALTQVGDCE